MQQEMLNSFESMVNFVHENFLYGFSKDKDKETSRMYFEAGQLGWLLHLQKDLI